MPLEGMNAVCVDGTLVNIRRVKEMKFKLPKSKKALVVIVTIILLISICQCLVEAIFI